MACYTVHMPKGPDAILRMVLVRDGFSFWAFAYGPLWLVRHGALIAALITAGALVGLIGGLMMLGASASVMMISAFLAMMLIGFEGSTLRRWSLAMRGFSEVGVVAGNDLHTLERRYFEAVAGGDAAGIVPPVASSSPMMPATMPSHLVSRQIIGLFPDHGAMRPLR